MSVGVVPALTLVSPAVAQEPAPQEPTAEQKEAAAKEAAAKEAAAKQAEEQQSQGGGGTAAQKSVEEILRDMREMAAQQGVDMQKAMEALQPQPTPPPQAQPAQPAAQPFVPGQSVPGLATPPARPVIAAPLGAQGGANAGVPPVASDEVVLNFTDAVELPLLINFVRDELGLQIIATDGGLRGQTIVLTQPIRLKRNQLLQFLVSVLEDREYTLTQDFTGIYTLRPKGTVGPALGTGPFTTTRILQTPNIKPSTLQQAITTLINTNRGSAPASQPVFMDDLGVIMLTDTPRVTALVEEFIQRVVEERASIKFWRFDLQNISAVSAKDRVMELLGQQQQRAPGSTTPGQPAPPAAVPGLGGSVTNVGEKLTIDPTANALYFRGRIDEKDFLQQLITLVDVPNSMLSEWYPVGNPTAEAVAAAGRSEQLGGVSVFESSSGSSTARGSGTLGRGLTGGLPGATGQSGSDFAGSGFILHPEAGGFIYRGTEAQQARVKTLVANLRGLTEDKKVVYEFYKLRHGKAADVAQIIQNLLSNTVSSGNNGGLLGSNLGSRNRNNQQNNVPRPPLGVQQPPATANATPGAAGAPGEAGGLGEIDGVDVFVIADEPNNQLVVKAPATLQPQFKQLINRIDLRRPQVYIDAKIVAITDNNDLHLAVEAQGIIGQFAFNTNFGLGSLTSGSGTSSSGGFTSPKIVNPGLEGLTAALIKSKYVPLVINAMASKTDSRIVATPQLLVDDNEEAEISSVDQQPTSTTTQSSGNDQISGFSGYQEAGPKLKVTPQISDGGYLKLDYEIELSSFQGAATANLPPPKLENKIKSASVTVPTDATIVVGGLTLDQKSTTIMKIPLLGDIPLVGNLFKDQNYSNRKLTLFVFITPRIMRDPTFADLRLITQNPMARARVESEFPPPVPERIDILDTAKFETAEKARKEAEKNTEPVPVPPNPPQKPVTTTPVRRASEGW